MMNECKIVEDLLPLYAEDLVSPETKEFVDFHCEGCEQCAGQRERMCASLDQEAVCVDYKKNMRRGVLEIVGKTVLVSVLAIGIYLYFLWEFGFMDKQIYADSNGNYRFEVVDCDAGFFAGGACIVTPEGQDINLYGSQSYQDFQVWYHPECKGYFACITFEDRLDTWLCLSEYDEESGMEVDRYYLSGKTGDRDFLWILKESELGQKYLYPEDVRITFDRWSVDGNTIYFNYEVPGGYFGEIIYNCTSHEVSDITCKFLRPMVLP